MSEAGKTYNLKEIDTILHEIGSRLTKPAEIIAVGGYCMLAYRARESTQDIDFIPSESEFIVPDEYREIVNKSVLDVWELSLDYHELRSYCRQVSNFGNLTVYLADYDLMLAMKVSARERRTVARDAKDIEWLSRQKIDRERAYKAYKLITKLNPPFDEWSNDIDTELFLIRAEDDFVA